MSAGATAAVQELNVRITGSETGRSHTVYTVLCSAGVARWEVRKRFSDFVQLNAAFRGKQEMTAALPPKQLFGKFSEATIKRRETGLGKYLEILLQEMEPPQLDMMYAFLQVPQSLLPQPAASPSARSRESSSATSADARSALSSGTGNGRGGLDRGAGEPQISSMPMPVDADADHEDADIAGRQAVDQVSDKMVDIFQSPLPVSGRECTMRRQQYRAMVARVSWPVDDGEELSSYFLRMVGHGLKPEQSSVYAMTLEETRQALREGVRDLLIVTLT